MTRSLISRIAVRSRLAVIAATVAAVAIAIPVWAATNVGSSGGGATVTITKPAGVAENHVMLANIVFRGDSSLQVNAPADWNLIAKRTNTNNSPQVTQAVYYKVAGNAEPGTYQWSFGVSGTTNTAAVGGIVGYDDVDPANPIDASATNHPGDASVAATTGPSAPSVTTTQAFARVVALYGIDTGDNVTAQPAGMSSTFTVGVTSGNPDGRLRAFAAEAVQAVPNASGAKAATTGGSARHVAQTVALRRKPTKLGFTTSPQSGLKNTCLGPITVQTQGGSGTDPVNVTSDTVVGLVTDGAGAFFTDNTCGTQISGRTISSGSNSVSFYYRATLTGGGSHQVTASSSGLTSADQTQTITKLTQNITFTQPTSPRTYQDEFNVNPTSDSPQPLNFQATGGCTAEAATTGYDVTMTSGTTACVLTASQAANDDYNAASVQRTVNAQKKTPTITFTQPTTPQTYGEKFAINPTSDSPTTISVGRTGPCSVAAASPGFEATMTGGTGNCVLTASQLTNADWTTASLQRTVAAQKRAVTVTADPQSKVYGDPDPALTYQLTAGSLVSGDTFTGALGRASGDAVAGSPYAITQGTLSLTASNYALTYQGANLTISKKALTVTGAAAQDKTYDGNASAIVSYAGATLAGRVGTDDVALDTTASSATFGNKNVGSAKPVSVSGIALTGTTAGNYTVSSPAGLTADITKRNTTGSFTAANKVYDGSAAAAITGQSLAGEVAGDAVDLAGTATFANKAVGNGKTVTLGSPSLTGADAGNYNLTTVSTTTANITPKSVTGSFTVANKDFDGTTAATITGRSLAGAVSGDTVELTGGTATFNNANPGVDKPVTGTGFALGGTDAGNYTLASVGATTATIRQRDPEDTPPGQQKSPAEKAAGLLGGDVKNLGLDLGGLAFAFAPKSQGKIQPTNQALFAIGGCTAVCTIDAAKTLVLKGEAAASTAATKKIKLKTQKLSFGADRLGLIKLKLTKKQKKAIKKASRAKLVVKVTLKSGARKVTGKKIYRFKKG